MNLDEEKQLIKNIATSPEFVVSLEEFYENNKDGNIDIMTMALWFFSQGYLTCHEYIEKEKMTHPFSYRDSHDAEHQ